jgi:hypothetical protein
VFRRHRKGADSYGSDHRPVQQRPPRRQLHRRRRQGVVDRLRVLRQQRPVLRTGQRVERMLRCPPSSWKNSSPATTDGDCATRSPAPTYRVSSPSTAGRCGVASKEAPAQSTTTSGAGRWNATRLPSPNSRARTSRDCSTTCRPATDRDQATNLGH